MTIVPATSFLELAMMLSEESITTLTKLPLMPESTEALSFYQVQSNLDGAVSLAKSNAEILPMNAAPYIELLIDLA
jgi:hypothetical protein